MKTLIIYSHPDTKGHCNAFLKETKRGLKKRKVDFEVIDLYKIGYDPVLKEEELYTAGNRKVSQGTKEFQQKIKGSQNLIIIYPVWWGSTPAILKGFFDRVLTPGFAFNFKKGKIFPQRLLKGKKAILFLTASSPWIFYWLLLQAPKMAVKYFTLSFCGIKSKVYQLYSSRRLTEEKKNKIRNITKKGFDWLYGKRKF